MSDYSAELVIAVAHRPWLDAAADATYSDCHAADGVFDEIDDDGTMLSAAADLVVSRDFMSMLDFLAEHRIPFLASWSDENQDETDFCHTGDGVIHEQYDPGKVDVDEFGDPVAADLEKVREFIWLAWRARLICGGGWPADQPAVPLPADRKSP